MDAIDQDMLARERRDDYLAAMGIQVWALRGEVTNSAAVPGAAVDTKSIIAELSTRSPEDTTHEDPKLAEHAPPRGDAAPAVSSTPAPDAVGVAQDAVVPRFCLNAVYLPEQVLIVSDVPLESAAQPPTHQALLGEILVAIGFAAPAESQAACFKWPMFQQVKVDQGETVAREAAGAYVAAQLGGRQPILVLLLGEMAVRYVLPPEQGAALAVDQMSCPVLALPGLEVMLKQPGMKARAWKNICEYLGEQEQSGAF